MVNVKPKQLDTRPTVSIVVTCYNYGRYLEAAVLSALDQPGVDIEVIIADNGSTDDSLAIAGRLAASDSRISLHTQTENIHNLRNFNDGLELATGKYVQILCADDLLTPGSITRAVTVMESRPDVVMTYGNCPPFEDGPPPFENDPVTSWTVWDGMTWVRGRYREGTNPFFHPEVLMRTETLRDIGGYNTEFRLTSDMLLWIQAALRGNVARVNGPAQAYYRKHGANLHMQINADSWINDFIGRQQVFDAVPELDSWAPIGSREINDSRRALAVDAAKYACMALASPDPDVRQLGATYADHARKTWPAIESSLRGRTVRASIANDSRFLPRVWFRIDVTRKAIETNIGRNSRFNREPLVDRVRRRRRRGSVAPVHTI